MKLYVRNITNEDEFPLELPMPILELETYVRPGNEYIIVDNDKTLPLSELDDIFELNTFLENVREDEQYTEDDLKILTSAGFTLNEIKVKIQNGFLLIDFTEETKNWSSSDITSLSDRGLAIFTAGYYEFPFEYCIEMENYIDWERVWIDANVNGWKVAGINGTDYLVK